MEVDSDGAPVPSRKLVRRAKRPADANKIFEGGDVQPAVARRKQPRIVDDESAQLVMSDLSTPPGRSQRSTERRQSVSCARCRIYNWKEHRFAKPTLVKECRPPATRNDQKKTSPASTSDIFSWNLSLEERRKRDSRSALPTTKTVVVPAPSRRVLRSDRLLENGVIGECAHEESAVPMSIGPSTSEVNCCIAETPGRSVRTSSKQAGARRRKNGATTANSSAEQTLSLQVDAEEVTRGTGRTNSKRIMGQAAPMPLARTAREARVRSTGRNNDKEQQRSTAVGGRRSEAAVVKGVRASEVLTDGPNAETKEDTEKQCAQNEEKEKQQRTELAKRAMEELMKGQSFAPVEMIVADAISKDPLGFVHSLRDARLLKSLEKLAQLRQLNVSAEEARSLMKQRKKEKKREKREKKKQKRLMKLAANCGVSIEQLELEMSRDRSDSRASAPGSSPLSLNGSLLGSASTSTPTVLSSAALSNLPGPSPSSYLNVFPRPSFVPDPLNPSRNLAAERTDSSGADTPNADNYSPLALAPASIPTSSATHSNECDHCVGSDHASGFIVNDDQNVNLANETSLNSKQCGDCSMKVGKETEGGTNGNTPEDEEDEQNAIAISHLFPQFDALQQLKLIKMCTDSKVQEVDEQEVVSMVMHSEAGPSNKVARTLALIKDKVKEFKEINGMRRAISGGPTLQEGESRLESSDEGIDVGNTTISDTSALEQVRQNAMSSNWAIPEPAFSASEPVETRMTTNLQNNLQAHSNKLSGEQFVSPFTSTVQQPSTSTHADLSPVSSCITSMAYMGFGLQPRMLSILDEPLNPTPIDDHPPHRTPAVTLKEVPVDEDEENIYMSEVKVVTDWFNHAPYGADKEAHIRYWDNVRQRVLVADWIRKLQQHRVDQVLLNHSRRRMHRKRGETKTKKMRRSKSTEAWWPRKLFEHYDGVLDLAGKVMRTADSSLTASDVQLPSVNNASLKVFPLDDDETATLAYFRPGSPLTVSDPTDDYQEHVLAQDLDEATVISKNIVEQMDLGQEDEKARYLPWLKVRRMTPYKSVSAHGSTRPLSQTSNKYASFAPFSSSMLESLPSQPGSSTGILPRSILVSNRSVAAAPSSSILKHPAAPHFLSNAPAYGFLQPNGCYPPQSVYAGLVTPVTDKLPMPTASQLPLLAPHSAGESMQIGLPPLSTVLDNLQPSGSGLSYMQMSTQRMSAHSIPGAADTNPYAELAYSRHSVGTGQPFAGFPPPAAPLAPNFYDGKESTGASSANNGDLHQGLSTNDLVPSDFPSDSTVSGYRNTGGLTKDTVIDQEMEDFFRTVLDECDTRPMAHSQPQPFFDEDVDTVLSMDPLA